MVQLLNMMQVLALIALLCVTESALAGTSAWLGSDNTASDANLHSYLWPQVNAPDYHVNDIWLKHKPLPVRDEVIKYAGDTLDYLPKEYLRNYKNPCWMVGNNLKCLPYFQILGVSKCGTTDYYHRLTLHPEMVDCGWKGPHFWDESMYPSRPRADGKYDGSFPAYVNIFDKPAQRISQSPATMLTGEASSNTYTAVLSHLRGHRGRLVHGRGGEAVERRATLAHYLYEATPWARYIVLLRDPVTRYFSAFHYYRSRKDGAAGPQEFHERARMEIERWNGCVAKEGKLPCIKAYEPQQLVKGMYSEFLQPWLDVWPRSRFLIMRNEDYQASPREHMQAGFTFLGMRNLTEPEWIKVVGMGRKNSQSSKYSNGMLPETLKMLQDFYRPFNQALSAQLGNDPRWLWGY